MFSVLQHYPGQHDLHTTALCTVHRLLADYIELGSYPSVFSVLQLYPGQHVLHTTALCNLQCAARTISESQCPGTLSRTSRSVQPTRLLHCGSAHYYGEVGSALLRVRFVP